MTTVKNKLKSVINLLAQGFLDIYRFDVNTILFCTLTISIVGI